MKQKHTHQYKKIDIGVKNKYEVYKCVLPGCSHYMPNMNGVVGAVTLCNGGCGKTLIMTQQIVTNRVEKPICDDCKEIRKKDRALAGVYDFQAAAGGSK